MKQLIATAHYRNIELLFALVIWLECEMQFFNKINSTVVM